MERNEIRQRLEAMPQQWPRTVRTDELSTVTSAKPGKCVPLGFIPMLREDALETTPVRARVYMDETADLLLNTVNVVFSAYAVPKLAFHRYEDGNGNPSMDALNRSYMGHAEADGSVIPFVAPAAYDNDAGTDTKEIYSTAGLHAPSDDALVNSDFEEAYYQIFEYRCRQRSEALWDLVKGDIGDGELVPAFFDNAQMSMIQPSFDDAMLDGIIPLSVTNGSLPVAGIGSRTSGNPVNGVTVRETDGTTPTYDKMMNASSGTNDILFRTDGTGIPAIYAELEENGISISVANIDLARQMSSWARVRQSYEGLTDDDLIDLLLSGVAVPTQYQAMPQLLARHRVPFGMTQRYSTEAASLDVSATRGVAGADFVIRAPKMNTGGVVVIIAEVVPEQFWERSRDYHFLRGPTDPWPDRLLDELDPQKVEVVDNSHADVRHSDPDGIFGYGPTNHQHMRNHTNLGGKFFRKNPTEPWKEDRNRIWASEPVDPRLSKEFYLATDLPEEIFMFANQDNFEFSLSANANISGLTYIGPLLRESTGQYEAIEERVDLKRIAPADNAQPAAQQAAQPAPPSGDEPTTTTTTTTATAENGGTEPGTAAQQPTGQAQASANDNGGQS